MNIIKFVIINTFYLTKFKIFMPLKFSFSTRIINDHRNRSWYSISLCLRTTKSKYWNWHFFIQVVLMSNELSWYQRWTQISEKRGHTTLFGSKKKRREERTELLRKKINVYILFFLFSRLNGEGLDSPLNIVHTFLLFI